MKPSNNWTSTLIKLIQECPSETGLAYFTTYIESLTDYIHPSNEELIKALKEKL